MKKKIIQRWRKRNISLCDFHLRNNTLLNKKKLFWKLKWSDKNSPKSIAKLSYWRYKVLRAYILMDAHYLTRWLLGNWIRKKSMRLTLNFLTGNVFRFPRELNLGWVRPAAGCMHEVLPFAFLFRSTASQITTINKKSSSWYRAGVEYFLLLSFIKT